MPAVADLFTKEEFTTEKLDEIYRQAFMDPHMEETSEIKIVVGGVKVYAKIEGEPRFLMRLTAAYGIKPDATRQQILELCNRVNDKLILVRACYPEIAPAPMLWIDHYLDTTAGLTAEEAVDETRRFASVCGGIGMHDVENIMT